MDGKVGHGLSHPLETREPIVPESLAARPKVLEAANPDSLESTSKGRLLGPERAAQKVQNPYEKLQADLTEVGNLRAARQKEMSEQSSFTKLLNFFRGDKSKTAHDAKIDELFRRNPQLALHELSVGDWGKNSGRYLSFDSEGNLSVRDSKSKGHDDTSVLKRLTYWLNQHSAGVDDEVFDSLKNSTKQLYQRAGTSRTQGDAYAAATRSLYAANPERAKSELLSESDSARFVTFDELGNPAIHDVRPRGYDYSKELQGFHRWVQNRGTELSPAEARSALSSFKSLESDARANSGFIGRPDYEGLRSAVTDSIYRKSPGLAHQEILNTPDWGKKSADGPRYLHVSSDGKSASIREQRPKSHTENFLGLARYIGTLDPKDSGTPAVIKGIQKYVEQFGKEAWTNSKERDAALAQLQAQIDKKNQEGSKVRAQARAAQEEDSRAEIFRLTH